MNYYSFKISEPCHEDWNEMSPAAKGRFCSSCATTVIDFTKMTPQQIHDYMESQKGKRVCGRLKQQEQEKLIVKIPVTELQKPTSPYRVFACSLLIIMGTTLLSCNSKNGNKQKIDAVEVVDTNAVEKLDSLIQENNKEVAVLKDSLEEEIPVVMGMLGPPPSPPEGPIVAVGKVVEVVGDIIENKEYHNEVPFAIVDKVPRYKDTPEHLSKEEFKSYFTKRLTQEIRKNFNTKVIDSTLKDRHKIAVQFKIDTIGTVVDIKVKARYKELEKETIRVLNMLPQFIPGEHRDEKTTVIYLLPIIFENK